MSQNLLVRLSVTFLQIWLQAQAKNQPSQDALEKSPHVVNHVHGLNAMSLTPKTIVLPFC